MSKPDREEYWSLFQNAGIKREEFERMPDDDFNNYITVLVTSLQVDTPKGGEPFMEEFYDENLVDDPNQCLSIEETARVLAKKSKDPPFPIHDFVSKGQDFAKNFIRDFEGQPHASLEVILASSSSSKPNSISFPPMKNPNFGSSLDIDSQGII